MHLLGTITSIYNVALLKAMNICHIKYKPWVPFEAEGRVPDWHSGPAEERSDQKLPSVLITMCGAPLDIPSKSRLCLCGPSGLQLSPYDKINNG